MVLLKLILSKSDWSLVFVVQITRSISCETSLSFVNESDAHAIGSNRRSETYTLTSWSQTERKLESVHIGMLQRQKQVDVCMMLGRWIGRQAFSA
jgi:hypothetical protein